MDSSPEYDMTSRIAALLPVLLGAAGLHAEDAKYQVEKVRDIPYNAAPTADRVRHKLDLYLPKGAKDFPVMVFVHGGAWKHGNKELYAPLGENFAKQGIGTAVINYRLTDSKGAVKHPDHIQDVAKAFAWIKANIGKYGGSKDKLFVSGHSAGGHLVALLALDDTYLKAEGCTTRDICGVMAVSGVYTISPLVLGEIFGKDEDVCKAASPISHVKGNHPPFLIAYGTRDFPFMDLMAEELSKKLKQCKCDATVMKMEQRDHFSIIIQMGSKADDPLTKAMVEFMTKK
jgi:dipeptidyl aminopeptidase/acylaminoacyl peptidase